MSAPPPPEHFAFLLVPGFSNLCLANAIEPLRAANEARGVALYRRTLATLDGAPVCSSSGIVIQPDCALADVGACDALFVLASYDYARASTPAMRRALSAAARRARAVGGLDTGSWLLAEAGLLSGRRATIHWQELESFEERFLDVAVSPERTVMDGPRITAGGATTTLDLMLRLIRERHGEALAFEVMALFIYDAERAADEPQRGARDARLLARAPEVAEAMRLMEASAEDPLSIAEIARKVGLSPRTLERRFRAHLGVSPEKCRLSIRLRKARSLARETAVPVSEIAARTGFSSSATLARAFRAAYGGSIRDLRRGRL